MGLPGGRESCLLEEILVVPDQAHIGTVHHAVVVTVERRDLLHAGEPLLAVLRPVSQVLIEWSQVACGYIRANQEAILAYEIGSGTGGTDHQVKLRVIASLVSNDGFQLDFDIRVSRLDTLFHRRPPRLFRIGWGTKLLIGDCNRDGSAAIASRRATTSLQYGCYREKHDDKTKGKEIQAFQ